MDMAFDPSGVLHVAYNTGSKSVLRKLKTDKTWLSVNDIKGFGTQAGEYIQLAFYADGTPIIAISGDTNNVTGTFFQAWKFLTNKWSKLGKNENVSPSTTVYGGIVIDQTDDTSYVVYSDTLNGKSISVRRHVKP